MSTFNFHYDEESPFDFYNFDDVYPRLINIIKEQESEIFLSLPPSPQANEREINYTMNTMITDKNHIGVIKRGFNNSYCIYMIKYLGSYYIIPFSPNKYFKVEKFCMNEDMSYNDDFSPNEVSSDSSSSDFVSNNSIFTICCVIVEKCKSMF